jgi:hypothetical protein
MHKAGKNNNVKQRLHMVCCNLKTVLTLTLPTGLKWDLELKFIAIKKFHLEENSFN